MTTIQTISHNNTHHNNICPDYKEQYVSIICRATNFAANHVREVINQTEKEFNWDKDDPEKLFGKVMVNLGWERKEDAIAMVGGNIPTDCPGRCVYFNYYNTPIYVENDTIFTNDEKELNEMYVRHECYIPTNLTSIG